MNLTHLSLFSGIGGLDIAAKWAGFTTIGQCEWADYPTKVLEKHWPRVPRWRDIRTLTKEAFHERTGMRTVDIISGGFPCQPFSVAGKRRGKEDDRYLWPEMLRVIKELRPRWVVGENVAGIVSVALDQVLSDMEGIGYTAQAFIIPACAVDAPHRRDRCAIVAHAHRAQWRAGEFAGNEPYREDAGRPKAAGGVGASSEDGVHRNMAHAYGQGLQGSQQPATFDSAGPAQSHRPACQCGKVVADSQSRRQQGKVKERGKARGLGSSGGRPTEPGLGGMADGFPYWMDEPLNVPRIAYGIKGRVARLKCLGNAVVPQQFYPIFEAIAQIERNADL